MDNQQALTAKELGWLCGFFDGEGYVGMNVSANHSALNKVKTSRLSIIIPRLVFSNTHYPTIMRVKELLDRQDIGVHIGTGRKNSEKHLPIYRATVSGHKRCLKAVPLLLSECITKRPPLLVMGRWLQHRQANYHYCIKDYEFYVEFMKANGRKSINDSTLRRLYVSCTAGKNYSDGVKRGWETRRKRESGREGNLAG